MRFKISSLILLLLLLFSPCFSQNKNDLDEMINQSIQGVVEKHNAYIKRGTMAQEEFDKYYILNDYLPRNFIISDENKNLKQKILHLSEIPYEELKKRVVCLHVGAVLNEDKIEIRITKVSVKAEKKRLHSDVSDTYRFAYKYFYDNQKWEFVDNSK